MCVLCAKSLWSCPTLCNPKNYSLPGSSLHLCPWDSPGGNTAVGCHFLLQGMFPVLGSNLCLLCLLHWQAGVYHQHHLESIYII